MISLGKYFAFISIVLIFTTLDMWLNINGFLFIKATLVVVLTMTMSTFFLFFASNETKNTFFRVIKEASVFYFLFYLFAIYALLGILFISDLNNSNITQAFLYIYSLLIITLSIAILSNNDIYQLANKYIGVALLILCFSVFVDVLSPGYFGNYPQRAAGFPENPTRAAIAVNFALIGALNYKRFLKIDYLYIVLSALALFSIMSKTGVFIFSVIIFLYMMEHKLRFFHLIKHVSILAISLLLVAYFFTEYFISDSIFSLAGNKIDRIIVVEGLVDISARANLWEHYITLIGENLFFGKGAGYIDSLEAMGAHNFFIHSIIEFGIVGLLILILILIISGIYAYKSGGQLLTVYIALLMLSLVHSTPLYERTVLFMIAFSIVSAYRSNGIGIIKESNNTIQKKEF